MNIVEELTKHGVLFNEETLDKISTTIMRSGNLEESYISDVRTFYYTGKDNNVRRFKFADNKESKIKIVKFMNTRNFFTNPWCFGFIKDGNKWIGAYAGRHNELFTQLVKLVKRIGDNPITKSNLLMGRLSFPKSISRADVFTLVKDPSVFREIFNLLEDQEEWGTNYNLSVYIKDYIYIARDLALFSKELPNSVKVIHNGDKMSILLNTGLLDKFNSFVMIKATMVKTSTGFMSEPFYSVNKIEVVYDLKYYGLDDALPLVDLTNGASTVFKQCGNITLGDRKRMEHIFIDRSSRLIKDCRHMSTYTLMQNLEISIKLTEKRVLVDRHFLVPYLNIKWGKVSYLMPLWVDVDGELKVAGAIVLGEIRPMEWTPVTLLNLDIARSNARLLGKLHSSWLG